MSTLLWPAEFSVIRGWFWGFRNFRDYCSVNDNRLEDESWSVDYLAFAATPKITENLKDSFYCLFFTVKFDTSDPSKMNYN